MPELLDSLGVYLLPILGLLLIITGLIMGIRKRRNRASQQVTGRENLERMKQETAIKGDLESLMVEIEQYAKRMGSQLDAKSQRLERLVERAERAAQALENPPQDRSSSSTTAGSGSNSSPTPPRSPSASAQPPGNAAPPPPETTPPATEPTPSSAPQPGDEDPLTRSVYDLADRGWSAADIANELDEHAGKVELILALRQG